MALFNECTQSCARIVLDMAGIVRDGDVSTVQSSAMILLTMKSVLEHAYGV